MSASMARQGGRVQIEQSDMRLALDMANMAKKGFSRAAIEETKYLLKKPRTEVREEKKRGVEFPVHKKIKAAIQRHPAMRRQNQMSSCLPCRTGTRRNPQTHWTRRGTGVPPPARRRERIPEQTPPAPGTPPPRPVTLLELIMLISSICRLDIRMCIQLFPGRNISKMMRIPSTIPSLIQIC